MMVNIFLRPEEPMIDNWQKFASYQIIFLFRHNTKYYVITLNLTRGSAFPVTIAEVNCNALIDTGATGSCISETFIVTLCYHGC